MTKKIVTGTFNHEKLALFERQKQRVPIYERRVVCLSLTIGSSESPLAGLERSGS
jgi:hypothetical protein